MSNTFVDYRVDRYGKVFGVFYCGTEQRLTDEEVRKLAQVMPEVFLKL